MNSTLRNMNRLDENRPKDTHICQKLHLYNTIILKRMCLEYSITILTLNITHVLCARVVETTGGYITRSSPGTRIRYGYNFWQVSTRQHCYKHQLYPSLQYERNISKLNDNKKKLWTVNIKLSSQFLLWLITTNWVQVIIVKLF